MSQNLKPELKGIIDIITEKFLDIMSIKPFKTDIDMFLRKEYMDSLSKVETEVAPNINFVPKESEISFLSDYVFQNMQATADDVGNKLRQEIQRGILNKESPQQLKKRIKELFSDKKYSNRLKTIMRTEKVRANNSGAFSGAEQAAEAGIVMKKYLDITIDDRTSNICKHGENPKYGTKEKAIPLDEEFTVKVDNKTYKALYPPFHINCRSVIRFVRYDK